MTVLRDPQDCPLRAWCGPLCSPPQQTYNQRARSRPPIFPKDAGPVLRSFLAESCGVLCSVGFMSKRWGGPAKSIRSSDRSRGRIGNKETLASPVMQNYSPWASVSLYEVEGPAALLSTTLQQQSPCFHGAELRLETAQIWRYHENMVLGWWASAAHAPRLSQRHKEVSQAPLLAPSHDRQHSPPYVSLLNKGYKDTGLWMC